MHAAVLTLHHTDGRVTRAREGTIIGSLLGAALGGFAGYQFCRHNSSFANDPCTTGAIGGGVLGGALGALVGYSIGHDIKRAPKD
jgi:outer membrane lipoprotein SlyB